MNNLFPAGYEDEVIEVEDTQDVQTVGYRNGLSFDEQTGDFRRDGMNKILDSDGIESWRSWCINCIQTERYKHLAYSTDFGIELDSAFAATSREEAESILIRQITEAIMADPYKRTQYIEELEFDWTAPDTIEARLVINGIEGVSIDFTAYITNGER